jgi:hypothetical protein
VGLAHPLIGDLPMKKSILVLAAIAASCSIAAANELKQDNKAVVQSVAATQMTDAEMDTVTAGAASGWQVCTGNGHCHPVGGGGQSLHRNTNNGFNHSGGRGARFTLIP